MITKPATVFYDLPFAVLEVSGTDASQFLQGQLTCNINELVDKSASIAAFCNAKGRVISTLIIIKADSDFLVVLPSTLVETVQKKLQMYVLRSKVSIQIASDLMIAGLATDAIQSDMPVTERPFPCETRDGLVFVKMPSKRCRYLCLGPASEFASLALEDTENALSSEWQYQDISSGMPWFNLNQSEKFIPQMLNIDKLGGISFNKGCYTGQEIVARTHYLGQAKRQLHLAECERQFVSDIEKFPVVNSETLEKCGDILAWQSLPDTTRLLIVLQSVDDASKSTILGDADQTAVKFLPFE